MNISLPKKLRHPYQAAPSPSRHQPERRAAVGRGSGCSLWGRPPSQEGQALLTPGPGGSWQQVAFPPQWGHHGPTESWGNAGERPLGGAVEGGEEPQRPEAAAATFNVFIPGESGGSEHLPGIPSGSSAGRGQDPGAQVTARGGGGGGGRAGCWRGKRPVPSAPKPCKRAAAGAAGLVPALGLGSPRHSPAARGAREGGHGSVRYSAPATQYPAAGGTRCQPGRWAQTCLRVPVTSCTGHGAARSGPGSWLCQLETLELRLHEIFMK